MIGVIDRYHFLDLQDSPIDTRSYIGTRVSFASESNQPELLVTSLRLSRVLVHSWQAQEVDLPEKATQNHAKVAACVKRDTSDATSISHNGMS